MPFKLNQDRRRRIPRQKHRVTNSAAYDATLRQRRNSRSDLRPQQSRTGGRSRAAHTRRVAWYSPLAILAGLTLRALFRLALRQAEGMIGSIIGLLGLELRVPDHSTLNCRAKMLEVPRPQPRRNGEPTHLLVDSTGLRLCGTGEWLLEKRGQRRVGPGESCTSAWIARRTRSLLRRLHPWRSTTVRRSAPCSIRSPVRSPGPPAMADTTKTASTPAWLSAIQKRRSSSRCPYEPDAERRDRAHATRRPPAAYCRAWAHGVAERVWIQQARPGRSHHEQGGESR